jgi:hypothetical protein
MPLPLRYYTSSRRDAVQLDFRAADLAGAPARLRRRAAIKHDRALLSVNSKNVDGARAPHRRAIALRGRGSRSAAESAPVGLPEKVREGDAHSVLKRPHRVEMVAARRRPRCRSAPDHAGEA